jgi:hypothetical protein
MTQGNRIQEVLKPMTGAFRKAFMVQISRSSLVVTFAVLITCVAGIASASAQLQPTPGPSAQAASLSLALETTSPCFYQVPSCASSDPKVDFELISNGDTTGCTFSSTVTWGDGDTSSPPSYPGGPNGSVLVKFHHKYITPDPFIAPTTYDINWSANVVSGTTCVSNSGTLQFNRTCTAKELSGPAWASMFPTSTSVSDLSGTFRTDVTNFINAMTQAGIAVNVLATLRPPERAYLMHYSWLVAKGQLSAQQVPAFAPATGQAPVNICWSHTDSNGNFDPTASTTAARKLMTALGIDPRLKVAPALNSLHTRGLAIDMTTKWTTPSITIDDASGNPVTINTTPHSGLNKQLITVGATYGVIHFINAAKDPNHWSVNGH